MLLKIDYKFLAKIIIIFKSREKKSKNTSKHLHYFENKSQYSLCPVNILNIYLFLYILTFLY